jgi:hypothetical protein
VDSWPWLWQGEAITALSKLLTLQKVTDAADRVFMQKFLILVVLLVSFNALAFDSGRSPASGGKDGATYQVTTNRDYGPEEAPIPGTLRYAIEKVDLGKPLTITFKLPPGYEKISLKQPLRLRSDLTIDGRTHVTLSTYIDWSLYELDADSLGSKPQCRKKATTTSQTTILVLDHVHNVIITGLHLSRDNYYNSTWEKRYPHLNRLCLGDIISFEDNHHGSDGDNIWIHENTIQNCGDGCIDASRISMTENILQDPPSP